MRLISVIFLFVCSITIYAQDPLVWPYGTIAEAIDFRTGEPAIIKGKYPHNSEGSLSLIADSSGELRLFSQGDKSFGVNHEVLRSNQPLAPKRLPENNLLLIPKPGNASRYYLFFNGASSEYVQRLQLKLIEIDLDSNGKKGDFVPNTLRSLGTRTTYTITAHQNEDGSYWLVTRNYKTFVSYKIDETGISPIDELDVDFIDYVGDWAGYHFKTKFSRDGKVLFSTVSLSNNNTIRKIDFDTHTGEFIKEEVVFHCVPHDTRTGLLDRTSLLYGIEFSPNDSLVYISLGHVRLNGINYPISNLLQLPRYSTNIWKSCKVISLFRTEIGSSAPHSAIKLGPDGRLYCTGPRRKEIDIIQNPNVIGDKVRVIKKAISHGIDYEKNELYSFPEYISTITDYLDFDFEYSCEYRLSLINNSKANHFKNWEIDFGDGNSLSTDDPNIEYRYSTPGQYLIKIKSTDIRGNTLFYLDTAYVEDLEKPEASMFIEDSIHCEWATIDVINTSKVRVYNNVSPTALIKANGTNLDTTVLTGDPTTSQLIFTKDGNYEITLIVDNGFCSDTTSLDYDLTILKAPKPDLNSDTLVECAPFYLDLEYANQDLVDSIKYDWGDGNISVSTNLTSSHRYFNDIDTIFEVTQSLFGPTGCITESTKSIKLLAGIPENYMTAGYVSFNDENQIEIYADNVPAATQYNFFKSGKELSSINSTKFLDPQKINLSDNSYYQISAETPCGSKSVISKKLFPILLTGSLSEKNTSYLLEWNLFNNWAIDPTGYDVEKLKTLGVLEGVQARTLNAYLESENLEIRNDQLYFRIKAVSSDESKFSYSNTIVLEYNPVIYIPNAITPNSDNLNDEFNPYLVGLTAITISIYNKWGQRIIHSQSNDPIDMKDKMAGTYFYVISGITRTGIRLNQKGTINLIK